MTRLLKNIFIITLPFMLIGCDVPKVKENPKKTPTKAHAQLLSILKDEYGMKDIITRQFDDTLWIYLPLEKSFLEINASAQGPQSSDQAEEKTSVKFVDCSFASGSFTVNYEIAPARTYAQDYGYNSAFSQEYQDRQRQILTAVSRAYNNVYRKDDGALVEGVPGEVDFADPQKNETHKELVHSHVMTDKAPSFIVLIIADIIQGLETETIFTVEDLNKASFDQYFQEEYSRRVITGYPTGLEAIKNDKEGTHVNFYDLTWPEFIAKQIKHRIKYKYERSSIKPESSPEEEILKSASDALSAYSFTDYSGVTLKNLLTGEEKTINKDELFKEFPAADKEQSKGRLIEINFK